jgi:hypothetical protein
LKIDKVIIELKQIKAQPPRVEHGFGVKIEAVVEGGAKFESSMFSGTQESGIASQDYAIEFVMSECIRDVMNQALKAFEEAEAKRRGTYLGL